MNMFKPAVKREAKLRLAIAGPSGAGKTFTALTLATALGERVAVVDTEHGSASKYADLFSFDVLNLEAPFHPKRFVEAINAAASAGYDVVVLDSLSHAWNGPGGVLEIVDMASRKFKGNTYAGWQEGTPAHNALIEGILSAPLHVIGTMRSKQEYVLVDRNGRQAPQKMGMAPVQRDGMEYEFDVYLDMDIENNAIVSKTRCPAIAGQVIPKPGRALAETLREWLSGEPPLDDQGNNGYVTFDELQPAMPTFTAGQQVLVKGKNDEKLGEIVAATEGGNWRVKVAGKELVISDKRLTAAPEPEPEQVGFFEEEISNGAYAER